MKKVIALIVCTCVLGMAGMAAAQTTDSALPKAVGQAVNALAHLDYKISNELNTQDRDGMAVCINDKGVFITRDILPGIPAKELKDFTLTPPGLGQKPIPAKFLGMDPLGTFYFLQIVGENPFKPVTFADASKLQMGQKVYSLGLLGQNASNTPYLGEATVSARLSFPEEIVLVTGGDLSVATSPVFSADGKAVGIVGPQLPLAYQMIAGNQRGEITLTGRQATKFFTPVEELAAALKEIPESPDKVRRLPWFGIINFLPYNPQTASQPSGELKAAVEVGFVVPDSPADKGGLKRGDVITAINGKPLEALANPQFVADALNTQLLKLKMGEPMTLTVLREGKKLEGIKMNPEPMPFRPFETPRYYSNRLGFAGRDLSIYDKFAGGRVLTEKGVVIMGVRDQSAAATGGLQAGDMITAVNDKATPSSDALDTAVKAAGESNDIRMTVFRNGNLQQLTIKQPMPK